MGSVRQLEYTQIEQEDTWGTDPDGGGAGGWGRVGLAPDEYSVELENEALEQDKHTGEIDSVYVDIVSQMLQGSMSMQVWPDNVGLLLAMAGLPRANNVVPSWSIQCYDQPKGEYLVHTGLKCDKLEIAASGSDPKLKFNYDFIGKAEAVISSFVKPTLPGTASYEFSDTAGTTGDFTINGAVEENVTEFSITISNNLAPSEPKDASRNCKWIDEGRRNVELSFTIHTDTTMANHYRSLVRSRTRTMPFVVVFDYPGTGSPYDVLTITVAEVVLQTAVRTGGVGDIQTIVCTGIARKPAAADAIVVAAT